MKAKELQNALHALFEKNKGSEDAEVYVCDSDTEKFKSVSDLELSIKLKTTPGKTLVIHV